VWAPRSTLDQLEDRPWLSKRADAVLESNSLRRSLWQRFELGPLARRNGCSLVFAPGGVATTTFRPVVTMCRNMLPFEPKELRRFGLSAQTARLMILRLAQARSFRQASGVIFLTAYARSVIADRVGPISGVDAVVPHGIDGRFFEVQPEERSTGERPLEIVYVSIVDHYKHQDAVSEAVARLAAAGAPVHLTLVGPAYAPALRRLRRTLARVDPEGRCVEYAGPMEYKDIHAAYARADIGLFASSCENMPNILLEKMAAGLPIACSNRGPMPEILGDAGVYFDPESVDGIMVSLMTLIGDPSLRNRLAGDARRRASQYSWGLCAEQTFAFLARVADTAERGRGEPGS